RRNNGSSEDAHETPPKPLGNFWDRRCIVRIFRLLTQQPRPIHSRMGTSRWRKCLSSGQMCRLSEVNAYSPGWIANEEATVPKRRRCPARPLVELLNACKFFVGGGNRAGEDERTRVVEQDQFVVGNQNRRLSHGVRLPTHSSRCPVDTLEAPAGRAMAA